MAVCDDFLSKTSRAPGYTHSHQVTQAVITLSPGLSVFIWKMRLLINACLPEGMGRLGEDPGEKVPGAWSRKLSVSVSGPTPGRKKMSLFLSGGPSHRSQTGFLSPGLADKIQMPI